MARDPRPRSTRSDVVALLAEQADLARRGPAGGRHRRPATTWWPRCAPPSPRARTSWSSTRLTLDHIDRVADGGASAPTAAPGCGRRDPGPASVAHGPGAGPAAADPARRPCSWSAGSATELTRRQLARLVRRPRTVHPYRSRSTTPAVPDVGRHHRRCSTALAGGGPRRGRRSLATVLDESRPASTRSPGAEQVPRALARAARRALESRPGRRHLQHRRRRGRRPASPSSARDGLEVSDEVVPLAVSGRSSAAPGTACRSSPRAAWSATTRPPSPASTTSAARPRPRRRHVRPPSHPTSADHPDRHPPEAHPCDERAPDPTYSPSPSATPSASGRRSPPRPWPTRRSGGPPRRRRRRRRRAAPGGRGDAASTSRCASVSASTSRSAGEGVSTCSTSACSATTCPSGARSTSAPGRPR